MVTNIDYTHTYILNCATSQIVANIFSSGGSKLQRQGTWKIIDSTNDRLKTESVRPDCYSSLHAIAQVARSIAFSIPVYSLAFKSSVYTALFKSLGIKPVTENTTELLFLKSHVCFILSAVSDFSTMFRFNGVAILI